MRRWSRGRGCWLAAGARGLRGCGLGCYAGARVPAPLDGSPSMLSGRRRGCGALGAVGRVSRVVLVIGGVNGGAPLGARRGIALAGKVVVLFAELLWGEAFCCDSCGQVSALVQGSGAALVAAKPSRRLRAQLLVWAAGVVLCGKRHGQRLRGCGELGCGTAWVRWGGRGRRCCPGGLRERPKSRCRGRGRGRWELLCCERRGGRRLVVERGRAFKRWRLGHLRWAFEDAKVLAGR